MTLNIVRGLKNAEDVLVRIDPTGPEFPARISLGADPPGLRRRCNSGRVGREDSGRRPARRGRRRASLRQAARRGGLGELPHRRRGVADAKKRVSPELRESLELAAARIRSFHESTMPVDWMDSQQGLGELVRPLDRVGLYAPGGTAAYPSTVLMTAIPARVAGVREVILTTPRLGEEPLNPAVVVAAEIAGVDGLYQLGGVPAIAAMAYGTESVPKVDKICGPGNVFVAYAKRLVQGSVDIDGVFGPTETMILADDSANADFCAADLIAQAEHDPWPPRSWSPTAPPWWPASRRGWRSA